MSGLAHAYQPIVCLGSGRCIGYEALLRVDGLTPQEVFRRAREAGREAALDLDAVRAALEGAKGRLSREARLFVNLRPATLRAIVAGEISLRKVADAGVRLVFEVSEEPGAGSSEAELCRLRQELADAGEVALDDVGDGFQELHRLRVLRPHWVKVARSLVAGIDSDSSRRDMMESLVRLVRTWDGRVVAEGIETPGEYRACRSVLVGYGQGFLIGRPAGAGENGLEGVRPCLSTETQ